MLTPEDFPLKLREIPDQPKQLYFEGNLPPPGNKILCVVGARKYTSYGKEACEKLIGSLQGKAVSIISGLAVGIDTIAHKAALAAGLHTLAVPGSGLNRNVIYPRSNRGFADTIISSGGGLLSEFDPNFISTTWAFPMRNRIMAGLSDAVLIIEAEKKSGTLITARLATEYNRDVLAVPGTIFSQNSEGPHLLIRLGATPITCINDLHEALGFSVEERKDITYVDCSEDELKILEILIEPKTKEDIIYSGELPTYKILTLLSLLEMKGYIKEHMGMIQKVT